MNGHVDDYGRALVTVSIRPSAAADRQDVEVWIDTGFDGDLVLPQKQIEDLSLSHSGTIKAILADGSEVALNRYLCQIDWFGDKRELEVIANDGDYPLLGVGLLLGHDLSVSYRSEKVSIE
jgi:clan AA aspartic protease